MLPNPLEEPLVTVPRAANLLGWGRSATYDAASRGELPTIRRGRAIYVPTAGLWRLCGLEPPTCETAPASAVVATTDVSPLEADCAEPIKVRHLHARH